MQKRQRKIDFNEAAVAGQARRVGVAETDLLLLIGLLRCAPPKNGESYVRKSKSQLQLLMRVGSRNTTRAALKRLQDKGILAFAATKKGHEILIDWQRLFKLPDAPCFNHVDALRGALQRGEHVAGQALVSAGQIPARVLVRESKARGVVSDSVVSVQRGLEARLVRPWATDRGLTNEDLAHAVRTRCKRVLVRLFKVAVKAGWWDDTEDHKVRFLTIAAEAGTRGEKPMGLLTELCRRAPDGSVLRSKQCLDSSRDWAAETLRIWRRAHDPVLVEAEADRRAEMQTC